MYKHSILTIYTKYIPCSIYNEYSLYITAISPPDWNMHSKYMVYTLYIPVIWEPLTYDLSICSKTVLGLFCTFFIIIYCWYTMCISLRNNLHQRYIIIQNVQYRPRNVLPHIYLPDISGLHITGIYCVYSRFIMAIKDYNTCI